MEVILSAAQTVFGRVLPFLPACYMDVMTGFLLGCIAQAPGVFRLYFSGPGGCGCPSSICFFR